MRKDSEMRNVSEQLPIEFSIVIPTFNEKDNVKKLIEGISRHPNLRRRWDDCTGFVLSGATAQTK